MSNPPFNDSDIAFAPGGVVLYIGDTENKFIHLESAGLAALGIALDSATKIPDVIVHHRAKNWLLLIEAVTSAGPLWMASAAKNSKTSSVAAKQASSLSPPLRTAA